MSDFDKYFAERLEEEGQFPHREKNWKALSKRLDAFDTGLLGRSPRMRYWQAAAAVSIIAVSVLFGKVYQMHRENAGLREQIVYLKARQAAPGASPSAGYPATQEDKTQITVASAFDSVVEGLTSKPQQKPLILQDNDVLSAPERQNFQKNASAYSSDIPLKRQNRFIPVQSRQADAVDLKSERIAEHAASSASPNAVAAPSQVMTNQMPANPEEQLAGQAREKLEALAPLPAVAQALRPAVVEVAPIKELPVNIPVIKPIPHNFSTFRAGVQASVGLPKPREKGISPLTGGGVSVEYAFLRNLRLSASADWLHHEVNADTFLDHHHFPPYTPKPKPGHNLTEIEGTQRSQHYSLGVAYTLPLHFPVKPAIRIAHTWTHWSPAIYSFRFDKDFPSPPYQPKPEYEPQKSEPEWKGNNWRAGAGLEFETPRWVASVWADYSKSIASNDPVFDALFVRAGVAYKFD